MSLLSRLGVLLGVLWLLSACNLSLNLPDNNDAEPQAGSLPSASPTSTASPKQLLWPDHHSPETH